MRSKALITDLSRDLKRVTCSAQLLPLFTDIPGHFTAPEQARAEGRIAFKVEI